MLNSFASSLNYNKNFRKIENASCQIYTGAELIVYVCSKHFNLYRASNH